MRPTRSPHCFLSVVGTTRIPVGVVGGKQVDVGVLFGLGDVVGFFFKQQGRRTRVRVVGCSFDRLL